MGTVASVSPSCCDSKAGLSVHVAPSLLCLARDPDMLDGSNQNSFARSTNALRPSGTFFEIAQACDLGNCTHQPPTVSGHSLCSCLRPFKVTRQLAESCLVC